MKQMTSKGIKEMVAQNELLSARVKELEEKLATAQSAPAPVQPSKSKVQAEQALALLKAGPVTTAQLKEINGKYPSDPIYFVRTILKLRVVTHRSKDGNTTYSLPSGAPEAAAPESKA